MKDTTSRGDISEMQVAAALARKGMKLLRPLSSATRYDLLIDNEDGTFSRVQCKTRVLRNRCVVFRLYSISGHRSLAKDYRGQVDSFGVFCPQTNGVYLVPMAALGECTNIATLRVNPPRNGQRSRIRAATEFLIS